MFLARHKIKLKEKRKMQIAKNRIAAIAIAIFLTVSMGASMILIPSVSAHNPAWIIPTHAYITAFPSPVGVGQSVWIVMFIGQAPFMGAALTNNLRYLNYKLTITAPDGTSSSIAFPYVSDPTDAQDYAYTPTQVGTYNLTFSYPGQPLTSASGAAYVNDSYGPSTGSTTLTVQQTPLPALVTSTSAAPTAYWTRPIYGENTNWYTISSNWLGTGSAVSSLVGSGTLTGFPSGSTMERAPGDAVGSLTSHIMWVQPLEEGGVVGGNDMAIPGNTYFEGSAYENRFDNPIIVYGDLYYNLPVSFAGAQSGACVCQCLATGQILWESKDIPALSGAVIYDVENPDQHGVYPAVLFTSGFGEVFDAYTGDLLFNVTSVPSGTAAQGPGGEQLKYVFDNAGNATVPNWTLAEWNSSYLFFPYGYAMTPSFYNATGAASTTVTPVTIPVPAPDNGFNNANNNNNNFNFVYEVNASSTGGAQNKFDWNITVPWLNVMGNQTLSTVTFSNDTSLIEKGYSSTGANPDASNPATVCYAFYDNLMILRNGSLGALGVWNPFTFFAVDLNTTHSTFGQVLWWSTIQPAPGNITESMGPVDPTVGVFTIGWKETMQWQGFSMANGAEIWGPTPSQAGLDYFGNPIYPYVTGETAGNGLMYSSGMAGVLYAYNLLTGNVVWTYGNGGEGNSTNSYGYVPLGYYPTFVQAIGNGVIYLCTAEHTIETPIFKYALTRAINATTGAEIWTLSNYNGEFSDINYAIADGYSAFLNGYDDSIYCCGQGPTQTTVSAPNAGLAFGQPVVISGTVMDISPGTQGAEQKGDWPNGVPVASDAIMNDWMGYIYQQQPIPTNFTGVQVNISVIDANGNYRTIGTVTTTTAGTYSLAWTPDISGLYTVIATFAGNTAYYGSSAQAAFDVMPAPAATAAPTATPTSVANLYFVPAIAGLFVLIIIVAIVLALLMLRKRP